MDPSSDATLDTIVQIAVQIAQSNPDCAEGATRIATLADTLRGGKLDKGALRDALSGTAAGSDMSDAEVSRTVEAAASLSRGEA